VPFETEDDSQSGIVYVWIGSKACNEEAKLVQDIAEQMFNSPWVSLQVGVLFSPIVHPNTLFRNVCYYTYKSNCDLINFFT